MTRSEKKEHIIIIDMLELPHCNYGHMYVNAAFSHCLP